MVMDQTTTARRPAHSKVRLSRNEVIAAGRVKCPEFATSAAAVNGAMPFVAPAPKQTLSKAIEEQRLSLLNVLGIVRCIGMGVASDAKDPAPEFATAFELLECEIQRIATALEKIRSVVIRCPQAMLHEPSLLSPSERAPSTA
jgi:hypothetical protein